MKNRALSLREQVMLLFLVVLLIGLGYYTMFYQPLQNDLASVASQQSELDTQLQTLMAKMNSMDAMQAELERAREQRTADSLRQVAVMDSIRLAEQAKLPYETELTHKYYVILGSFKKDFNADNMVANLKKAGYSPVRIALKNGFDMVAAAGCDSYGEAWGEITKIEDNDLCPYDVWIYSTEQNLHK